MKFRLKTLAAIKTLTRDQIKVLLDNGYLVKPAGLYEPDHAPRGTRFVIWEGRGLYRITPPLFIHLQKD